jgi:hypothetical protein
MGRTVLTAEKITKPGEFQIVFPAVFVTQFGTADLNSNGDIMKQSSNDTL